MSQRLDRVIRFIAESLEVDDLVAAERVVVRVEIERSGSETQQRVSRSGAIDITLFRDIAHGGERGAGGRDGEGRGSGETAIVQSGRGWARITLSDVVGDYEKLLARVADQALYAVGPAWALPPPSAPARVDIADPAVSGDLVPIAIELARRVERAGSVRGMTLAIERAETIIRTSRGFTHGFPETLVTIEAVVASGHVSGQAEPGDVERVCLQSRRLDGLDLEGEFTRAGRRLADRRASGVLEPGRYDLVLARRALVPDNVGYSQVLFVDLDPAVQGVSAGRYGWFEPVVAQADARSARQGLTRYRVGQSIFGDRQPSGDPLTIHSDGTLPFGLQSRPVGELGEPVRRFTLVEQGIAVGLGFDLREAALRGVGANGGVRNLVIEPGSLSPSDLLTPGSMALVEAVEISWLDIDPRTGTFTCELGLAYVHVPGVARRPVHGGVVRGNFFDFLARSHLSTRTMERVWYHGPEALRIPEVEFT